MRQLCNWTTIINDNLITGPVDYCVGSLAITVSNGVTVCNCRLFLVTDNTDEGLFFPVPEHTPGLIKKIIGTCVVKPLRILISLFTFNTFCVVGYFPCVFERISVEIVRILSSASVIFDLNYCR